MHINNAYTSTDIVLNGVFNCFARCSEDEAKDVVGIQPI